LPNATCSWPCSFFRPKITLLGNNYNVRKMWIQATLGSNFPLQITAQFREGSNNSGKEVYECVKCKLKQHWEEIFLRKLRTAFGWGSEWIWGKQSFCFLLYKDYAQLSLTFYYVLFFHLLIISFSFHIISVQAELLFKEKKCRRSFILSLHILFDVGQTL